MDVIWKIHGRYTEDGLEMTRR